MADLLTTRDLPFIDTYTRIHLKWARSVYHFDFAEDGLGDKKKNDEHFLIWNSNWKSIYNFRDNS